MTLSHSLTSEIIDLSHDGRGVAKNHYSDSGIPEFSGKTAFIKNALVGETVRWRVTRESRQYIEGLTTHIERPSPQRTLPFCPHFEACGGCQLQHLSHEGQLAFKSQKLQTGLQRLGATFEELVPSISGDHKGYRRRARFHLIDDNSDTFSLGYYAASSEQIIPINECNILTPEIRACLPAITKIPASYIRALGVKQVEITHYAAGEQRPATHACLAIGLRTPHTTHPSNRALVQWADQYLSPNDLVYLASRNTPAICVYGNSSGLRDDLGAGIWIDTAPGDFLQGNHHINQLMLQTAAEWLRELKHVRLVDLFAGSGNIGCFLTQRLGTPNTRLVGVESAPEAVNKMAKNYQKLDLLRHPSAIECDLFETTHVQALFKRIKLKREDLVVLDPPRDGASAVCEQLAHKPVSQILYISCHTATLLRDIKHLVTAGYEVEKAVSLDMFPHTFHSEAMVLMRFRGTHKTRPHNIRNKRQRRTRK